MTPEIEFKLNEEEIVLSENFLRENVHLLVVLDDVNYISFLTRILKRKGTKIVEFPSIYEISSIIPFLLINDHSIILLKNPKKDILNILKLVIKKGIIINGRG